MERPGRRDRDRLARIRLSIFHGRRRAAAGFSRSAIPGNPVSGRIWKALSGGRLAGYFFVDHVIGKHLYIDYSVALGADGRVRRVEILTYRESYGFEVANAGWLAQFVGKSGGSALAVGQDIRNISGATLSSRHVTEGVKRILAYYATRLR